MIYLFTVTITDPDYAAEDYAAAWVRASEHIQRCPGARGTRLHRSLDDPRRLLAIARWESKTARDAMDNDPQKEIAGIIASQTPHVRIDFIGEFDDPGWVVLPPEL
jgi:heme-degrading monooxygenase HmoA